ncbi:MAG TPA: FAD-dependent oxidoreductase [Anaerolineae bacterium]|nr:FAD-dependent oxidoreductase [Anaerolineae bacterium]
MSKPVLLTVDDDPEVLQVVGQDLRRHYGKEYRILQAGSADEAVQTTEQLRLRGDDLALFLVDQRMPGKNGVEFLQEAMQHYPGAMRVLLTAYSDTEAAIRAINDARVHHYLLKPWHPPEQHLYPILDDLLAEWQATFRPSFAGVRVIGHRWSPKSHETKEFMARNQVPYSWLDLEKEPEAARLLVQFGIESPKLPLVVFPDGEFLQAPSNQQIAEKVGLQTRAESQLYDLIVVGGGPAGLAAAVYGASEGLSTLVIEREAPGGQAGMSSRIENYLGFPSGISGGELARRAVIQARRFGAEILSTQDVVGLVVRGAYRGVILRDGTEVGARAVVVATGVSYRRLEVPGIDALTGAGVYYGAGMTEGQSARGEDVYIVGGANSAGQAAVYFADYARMVTMLVRAESLSISMSHYLVERLQATSNICIRTCSQVTGAMGNEHLEALILTDTNSGQVETVPATSLFIFIGARPHTEWLGQEVLRDKHGFVLAGLELMDKNRPPVWQLHRPPYPLETSVPGVFVAGDVRQGSIKRVASAVGEGSIVVQFIHRYLAEV